MSTRFFLLTLLTLVFGLQNLFAQTNDPVLFSVEGNEVKRSEFEYIYSKTNGERADFSRKSLDEYLDLYVKFKLKVERAKEMKLDTIPVLQQELEGYRKQLANSYLVDKEVTEQLVREAYDRKLKDVDVSHIMVVVPPNAAPKDTLAAYNKVKQFKSAIDGGADFAKIAADKSDDKSAKVNGGNIGFITALLPDGFYNFESAAYDLRKGETRIVKSGAGYHLMKINGTRPARGEIEAAHILIRKDKADNGAKAKAKIDSIYQVLQSGSQFDVLAGKYSQDNLSASKGGNIGFFGINKYERSFENAAFAIAKEGDYTRPIETQVGWHVIKLLRKKPMESYEVAKRKIQPLVVKDSRYEMAKSAMLERIKKESKFKEDKRSYLKYTTLLSDEFKTHKWKAGSSKQAKDILFSLGSNNMYTVNDFEIFAQKNSRDRLRLGRSQKTTEVAKFLYDKFVSETLMQYEEQQLEKKYPEFKALMREYEEGILLFEATKILVWDKASQDTVGLKKYFEKNRDKRKYLWDERAEVSFYALSKDAIKKLPKVKKYAKKKSPKKVLKKFNKKNKILTHRTEIVEQGKNKVVDALPWKKKSISPVEINKRNQSHNFLKIEKIIPKSPKTLKEARGYVVADYQDYLERAWVKELKADYEVKINEEVLQKMVKK